MYTKIQNNNFNISKNFDQCAKKSSVTHWAKFAKNGIDQNIIFQTTKDKF